MSKDRERDAYRGHALLAARDGENVRGRAWKNNRLVSECEGKTIDGVMGKLRDIVDARLLDIGASRSGEPSGAEYAEAFRSFIDSLSDGQMLMLKAHYGAPDRRITATELAKAAGYANYGAANLQYGLLGRRLFEELPVPLKTRIDGTPIYTGALAEAGTLTGPEDHWVWKMRPGVAAALAHLGVVK